MYSYEHPRPALAADCIVFAFNGEKTELLLIKRKNEPFKGKWAIPGGFVEENETCETAAIRELKEETGVTLSKLELCGVYSDPNRDPRSRVVTVAYFSLIRKPVEKAVGQDDAEQAEWFPIGSLPSIAFDHAEILTTAKKALVKKALFSPIGLNVLPEKFTFPELHKLYESVLGYPVNIRTLQRKLEKYSLLVSENGDSARRKNNKLLSFDIDMYKKLCKTGFLLDLNEKE